MSWVKRKRTTAAFVKAAPPLAPEQPLAIALGGGLGLPDRAQVRTELPRPQPKGQAAQRPFQHRLIVRATGFKTRSTNRDLSIQELYAALARNEARNGLILDDVIGALEEGRSPILLTERKDHLEYFASHLAKFARHLVVLQGGMGAKERREVTAKLAAIGANEERLVLATGRYLGEGFDDARLDTLFLALPVSWKGTLVQYTGRLHRLLRNLAAQSVRRPGRARQGCVASDPPIHGENRPRR